MRKPKVLNPPARIWLQGGEIDEDIQFDDIPEGEVTWCGDKQFDTDVEYRLVKPARHRRGKGKEVSGG